MSTVAPVRSGSFGAVSAQVATPLAVVLSELVQNAVEHGLDRGPGLLEVRAAREDGVVGSRCSTTGPVCRRGSTSRRPERLGLQIVRTLVEGELGGTLRLDRREGGGTVAAVEVPLAA